MWSLFSYAYLPSVDLPWLVVSLGFLPIFNQVVFLLLNFESSLNVLDDSPLPEDFPGGASGEESACQCRRHERRGFGPWVRKSPWRREWQPTPVFLRGKSMDKGAWRATVCGVVKSQTWLNDWVPPLSDLSFADIFLQFVALSSHSLDSAFCRAELFNLNEVQLMDYFFHGSCLWSCA